MDAERRNVTGRGAPPRLRRPDRPALWVRAVRNGRGLVAARAFQPGDVLCRIEGELRTPAQVWRLWESDAQRAANCIRFSPERYLDPHGHPGRYANHSCRPNSGLAKRGSELLCIAYTPIARGEEVTHDYSALLGADDVYTLRCNCGEAVCRRLVGNVTTLSPGLLHAYWRAGFIPPFIRATLPPRLRRVCTGALRL